LCFPVSVFSLVFSQSLISLDLIEDFLELANREKTDKEKPPIYKGECHLEQCKANNTYTNLYSVQRQWIWKNRFH